MSQTAHRPLEASKDAHEAWLKASCAVLGRFKTRKRLGLRLWLFFITFIRHWEVFIPGLKKKREKAPPLPSTSFWPSVTPLGKIFFLSSAFRCRKNQRWQLQLCRLWRNHRYHRLWTLQNRFVIHKPVFFHAFLIGKKDFLTVAHYC